MSAALSSDRLDCRRAIEALRAGVPNRDAVRQLGSNSPALATLFDALLKAIPASFDPPMPVTGLLVTGEFGAGKSHLLEFLQHRALEAKFACSKVVISKETSLADPVKLFRAAAESLIVEGRVGTGVANLAARLNSDSKRTFDFHEWLAPDVCGLTGQFAASVALYERRRDLDFCSRVERFWAGDPISNPDFAKQLREAGLSTDYHLPKPPVARMLAYQRFQFLSRLVRAAGYEGWVLLIDEVELIGEYAFKTRARAYAELARWLGRLPAGSGGTFPGLGVVAAITSNFQGSVIIGGKLDADEVPRKLQASAREDDHALVPLADRGMQAILREAERLPRLSEEHVQRTFEQIRSIYARAYDWSPPPAKTLPELSTSSVMRRFIRQWITEWDMLRLFEGAPFVAQETPLQPSTYREDADLESSSNSWTDSEPS